MPNLLAIPFKKTYAAPIKQAARDYFDAHGDIHPDAFKWDINQWDNLRKAAVDENIHVNRIDAILKYHAQLVFVLTKLPDNIGLDISYAPVFSSKVVPMTLCSLAFERAALLFDLAALYSQLGCNEDRASTDGVKRATAYFQNAAGALSYLASQSLSKLTVPLDEDDWEVPYDLTRSFVKSLEWLMLAQAQECAWQKAVKENYKNGLIAKLAAQVSSFYRLSLTTAREAPSPIKQAIPSSWLAHLETKQLHFDAASQYRKSIEELEGSRYGVELGRLSLAQDSAKKGYNIARRGGVSDAVLQDIKSLMDVVQKDFARSEKDNYLIYHQDVPAASSLPAIQPAPVVNAVVSLALQDVKSAAGETVIFGELLGWGAREAIEIYKHNKEMLIKERVEERAQELEEESNNALRLLNLPAALEALEKPVGLSPSLLRKAQEVRSSEGPRHIETAIEDVRRLSRHASEVVDEAMTILDDEASDDERLRHDHVVNRLTSPEANVHLTEQSERYRKTLEDAAESDARVRQKWAEWEHHIAILTLDEAELERAVPSTTGSAVRDSNQTRLHARTLRGLLEQLDDLSRERAQLVERARRRADADDIKERIVQVASNMEQWAEVKPIMFEDISAEELGKYDRFFTDMEEIGRKQNNLLNIIKVENDHFIRCRKEDPIVKERERALQSLDLAYHKYAEIKRNLDEGLKFYNDFLVILTQFKESCRTWNHSRKQEMQSLIRSMHATSLQDDQEEITDVLHVPSSAQSFTPADANVTPSATVWKQTITSLDLPPPGSSEWETLELPPGPPPPRVEPSKSKKRIPGRLR